MKRISPFRRPKPPPRLPEFDPTPVTSVENLAFIERIDVRHRINSADAVVFGEKTELQIRVSGDESFPLQEFVTTISKPISIKSSDTIQLTEAVAQVDASVKITDNAYIHEQESVASTVSGGLDRLAHSREKEHVRVRLGA